jgi:hypothetical protein
MTDESAIILFEDGRDSKKLRVMLREFKGTPLLDMRYWYLDKKTKELKATSKGISLTRINYLGMRTVAVDYHDTVMEYLDVGSLAVSHPGDKIKISELKARQQQPIKDVQVEFSSLKPSSKLYEVEHRGSKAIVTLNKNHPLTSNLSSKNMTDGTELETIGKLILAIDLSLMNSRGDELTSPRIIAEQFEYDLSNYVRRLSRLDK